MRFEINRYAINIIPENDEDIAYIEDTLGLQMENETIEAKRINANGLSCIAHIEIRRTR